MAKKFVSLDRLGTFLDQIKALLTGKVDTSDINAKTRSELETIWNDSSVPDIVTQLTEIESVNATKIENEITRAKDAESTLQTKIENEATRATTAESILSADLAAEIDRATKAEKSNTTAISTNATNITNLETKVDELFVVVSTW